MDSLLHAETDAAGVEQRAQRRGRFLVQLVGWTDITKMLESEDLNEEGAAFIRSKLASVAVSFWPSPMLAEPGLHSHKLSPLRTEWDHYIEYNRVDETVFDAVGLSEQPPAFMYEDEDEDEMEEGPAAQPAGAEEHAEGDEDAGYEAGEGEWGGEGQWDSDGDQGGDEEADGGDPAAEAFGAADAELEGEPEEEQEAAPDVLRNPPDGMAAPVAVRSELSDVDAMEVVGILSGAGASQEVQTSPFMLALGGPVSRLLLDEPLDQAYGLIDVLIGADSATQDGVLCGRRGLQRDGGQIRVQSATQQHQRTEVDTSGSSRPRLGYSIVFNRHIPT